MPYAVAIVKTIGLECDSLRHKMGLPPQKMGGGPFLVQEIHHILLTSELLQFDQD